MFDARTLHQMDVHCSINMYIMRNVFHATKLKQHITLIKFLKLAICDVFAVLPTTSNMQT